MSARPLPVSTPAAQGVSARGVAAFVDALEQAEGVEPHSVIVLRHGHVIAQGWWEPYAADGLQLLYSLSKSFTSAATGLAVAEGLLSLDDRVLAHFPELDAEVSDERSRAMLVRHVAAMASGHLVDTWGPVTEADPDEPVRGFLRLPPEREPGTVFAYNQSATYALAAIVQRVTGQTLTDYLRPRLLDPLGIGEVGWQQHPPGRDLGFSGLHATTDAVARFGQLHLQGGRWEGRQLLSPEWVAEATRAHVASAGDSGPDWQQGYGLQFWRSRHGYRGDGAYGQFCLVLPEQDAVVAITAQTVEMQRVLDAVWTHLLPAFDGPDLAPDPAAEAALAERLARLALPPAPGQPAPPDPASWDGGSLAPADGVSASQPSLVRVTVHRAADGWRVGLHEHETAFDLPLGTGTWARSGPDELPAAVSGGWTGDEVLGVDVVLVETPHRLTVTCRLPEGTFEARWVTEPLRGGGPLHSGGLGQLRAPRR